MADAREMLTLTRDTRTPAARAELARRASRGQLVRVASGAYVEAAVWASLGSDARFRLRVHAVAATSDNELVLSHSAAAAIWRLPTFGRPGRVEALTWETYGSRSNSHVRRRLAPASVDIDEIENLRVTGLASTVVALARDTDFMRSVVAGDAALNKNARKGLAAPTPALRKEHLFERLAADRQPRGARRAEDVVRFLDGDSGSPGESVSRVTMDRAGLPVPVLQREYSNPTGGRWFVDFYWPEFDVIGESDGKGKYLDPAIRGGRSAAQVVLDEKNREDELRRQCRGFARWDGAVALSPTRLLERLARAGVRPVRRS